MVFPCREGHRFGPDLRLRKREEFNRAWAKGRKRHASHFIIIVMQKTEGPTRLGITASRKVGGAIQRNRVKRLVREFFRTHRDQLPMGADISIIAKKGAAGLDLNRVSTELGILLVESGKAETTCSKSLPFPS